MFQLIGFKNAFSTSISYLYNEEHKVLAQGDAFRKVYALNRMVDSPKILLRAGQTARIISQLQSQLRKDACLPTLQLSKPDQVPVTGT